MLFPASLSVEKGSGRTRAKVPPEARKRNPIACENCRTRKIRCVSDVPGESPCRQCEKTSQNCMFQELSPKVVVPKRDLLLLKKRCEALERMILESSSESRLDEIKLMLKSLQNETSPMSSVETLVAGSGNRSGTHTPYQMEDASGSDLLLSQATQIAHHGLQNSGDSLFYNSCHQYIFERSHRLGIATHFPDLSSTGPLIPALPHYTFSLNTANSENLLYPTKLDPYSLPDRNTLISLTKIYMSFFGTPYEKSNNLFFFGCEFTESFVDELYARADAAAQNKLPEALLAGINCVFAISSYYLACLHLPNNSAESRAQAFSPLPQVEHVEDGVRYRPTIGPQVQYVVEPAVVYLGRAKALNEDSIGMAADMSSARCYVLMAFVLWWIGQNDAAYNYVGRATRIALAKVYSLQPQDYIHPDHRESLLGLFSFDRVIGNNLGLPSLLVTLPARFVLEHAPEALINHAKLALAAGDLTTEIWRTENTGSEAGRNWISVVDQSVQNLTRWKEALPPNLQLTDGHRAKSRMALTLHLWANEAIINATRPALLTLLKAEQSPKLLVVLDSCYQHVATCLKTCRETLCLLEQSSMPQAFLETRIAKKVGYILSLGQLLGEFTQPIDSQSVGCIISFLRLGDGIAAQKLEAFNGSIIRLVASLNAPFCDVRMPPRVTEGIPTSIGLSFDAIQPQFWTVN